MFSTQKFLFEVTDTLISLIFFYKLFMYSNITL